MLRYLKGLFGREDPLVELARSGDGKLFAESFRRSEVFVVSTPVDRSLDPERVTADELRRLVDAAARAARDDSGLRAFTYGVEGNEFLPVFSSAENAEKFIRRYVQAAHRVIPFLTASLAGAARRPLLAGSGLTVVLNPLSESEYELPREVVVEIVGEGW